MLNFENQQSTNENVLNESTNESLGVMLSESAIENTYSVLLDHNNYILPEVFHNVHETYVKNIVAYIAGFVVNNISKSIKCSFCKKLLTNNITLLYKKLKIEVS